MFNGLVATNRDEAKTQTKAVKASETNSAMVGAFKKSLAQASKIDLMTTHWYTACHAFANPTGGRYDDDDAALTWARTHTFLAAQLQ